MNPMTAEQFDEAMAAQDANPGVKAPQGPQSGPRRPDFQSTMRAVSVAAWSPEQAQPRVRRVDHDIPKAYQGSKLDILERCAPKLRVPLTTTPAGERYGALFLGPSGCGKSSAASFAIQRWRAKAGGKVAWLDALEATDAERRYRLGSGDPEDLAEAYRADWLVLDDVGLTCSATLVQLVLARRYQACLPTIVTTGLERGQLVQHIGAATVRRIVEFEGRAGVMVDCHGGGQ